MFFLFVLDYVSWCMIESCPFFSSSTVIVNSWLPCWSLLLSTNLFLKLIAAINPIKPKTMLKINAFWSPRGVLWMLSSFLCKRYKTVQVITFRGTCIKYLSVWLLEQWWGDSIIFKNKKLTRNQFIIFARRDSGMTWLLKNPIQKEIYLNFY